MNCIGLVKDGNRGMRLCRHKASLLFCKPHRFQLIKYLVTIVGIAGSIASLYGFFSQPRKTKYETDKNAPNETEVLEERLQLGYATKAHPDLNPEPSFEAQQFARGMKGNVKGYQAIIRDIALGKFDNAQAKLKSETLLGEISLLQLYLSQGRLFVYRGKYDEGVSYLQRAADLSGQAPSILLEIVQGLLFEGQYADAAKICDELIKRFPPSKSTYSILAKVNTRLGGIRNAEGKYSEARDSLKLAMEYWRKLPNPDLIEVASTINDLGQTLSDLEDYKAAEPLLREALRIRERGRGTSVIDLSESYNNLGLLLLKENSDFIGAEYNYKKSYSLLLEKFGPSHPATAMEAHNLGSLYYRQKRYSAAEIEYQEALVVWKSLLPHNHPDVGRILNDLGTVYFHEDKLDKADEMFTQALVVWSNEKLRNHPGLGYCLTNIAALRAKQGRYAEAEELYRKAIKHLELTTSPDSTATIYAAKLLTEFYRARGMVSKQKEIMGKYKIRPEALAGQAP
jgi:tetratricopeptide (TPR) repeat protein